METVCRFLFFFGVVKPLTLAILGLNVRCGNLLPKTGPAILVANHNSHLDTLVLLSLFPYRVATKLRPVAAADYFFQNRVSAWFVLHILRVIPVDRTLRTATIDMLERVSEALVAGEIVLLFPEGTRGEPEHLARFKSGIAHIVKPHPTVPVIPVFLHGAGKALPRGESILVPFFCDVFVAEPLFWCGNRVEFMEKLEYRFRELAAEGEFPPWA